MNRQLLVAIIASLLFIGCNEKIYTPIQYEVLRPAYYTLPHGLDDIVIVIGLNEWECFDSVSVLNNYLHNNARETMIKRLPSLMCNLLRANLDNSGYLTAKIEPKLMPISTLDGKIDSLCKAHDSDALLVLSDASFKCQLNSKYREDQSLWGVSTSVFNSQFTVMMPQGTKFSLEPRSDTLMWSYEIYEDFKAGELYYDLPDYREVYYYTAQMVAEKMSDQLCPGWTMRNRELFVTNNILMLGASKCVRRGEWDKARDIWLQVLQKGKAEAKIHAALNLAIYYEFKDDVDNATRWSSDAIFMIEKFKRKNMTEEQNAAVVIFNEMMTRKREQQILEGQFYKRE